jgi:hypothetical protein
MTSDNPFTAFGETYAPTRKPFDDPLRDKESNTFLTIRKLLQ